MRAGSIPGPFRRTGRPLSQRVLWPDAGAAGSKHILELLPAENSRKESEQHNRFLISPRTMFEAEKRAREKGMDVLGFYHSHPNAEARPSRFDLDHAWPFYSYLIVSVSRGRAGAMTCWRLADDRSCFSPEEIESK